MFFTFLDCGECCNRYEGSLGFEPSSFGLLICDPKAIPLFRYLFPFFSCSRCFLCQSWRVRTI
ncbi:MAG: hypothetical protein DBW83_07480 [Synechococcus sp. MED-G69]|nr:MAG: hypothetical protein DBW83_07480 [Synechococcus sp. MED-G69]